jgi:hypothetical protein
LKQDHPGTNSAENQADGHRPKQNHYFAALFPRRTAVENRFSEQIDRRMFWFDSYNLAPIPGKSTTKRIYSDGNVAADDSRALQTRVLNPVMMPKALQRNGLNCPGRTLDLKRHSARRLKPVRHIRCLTFDLARF